LDQAVRFFIKACQEVGVPISKRVSEKVRSTSNGQTITRRRRAASAKTIREDGAAEVGGSHHQNGDRSWEEKLLDKFPSFDPAWPEDLKAKWFAGFERLMGAKPE
jgi:hypothetical protein